MGDVGDVYNALRDEDRARRSEAAEQAPVLIARIEALGHRVNTLSPNGPHLRIDGTIDFWPSTGRWTAAKGRGGGRGFQSLLAVLERQRGTSVILRDPEGRRHRGRRPERSSAL